MPGRLDAGLHDTKSAIFPYRNTDWLDSLPAYDHSAAVDVWLDTLRAIQKSTNYYWQGRALPQGVNMVLPVLGSYEDHISVEPGTYITAINAYTQQAPGFEFQVFDEGAQTYLYSRKFVYNTMAGQMVAAAGVTPFGPHFVPGPLVVLDPGLLTLQFTNLDPVNTNRVQVFLALAVPVTHESLGQSIVEKREEQ